MNYKHFVIGGALGLFALVGILVVWNLSGGPLDSEFVFKGPAAEFKSEELVTVFRDGRPEDSQQLKGKGVEVMGVVLDVEKPAVLMEEGALVFYFPESGWSKIEKKVSAGDVVTIRGQCAGLDPRRQAPTVVVKGCTLVDHVKNPHGGMPPSHP